MNPWLELNWRGTHARLVVYAGDQLQGRLPGDLIANVEEDVAIGFTGVRGALRPDVHITEKWDSGGYGGGTAVAAGPVADKGIRVAIDPADTRRIEIVDDTGVVITAIEFLSPTNKDGREGTRDYRYKVDRYLAAGVNVVEIDLLRAGAFALNYNPANLRGAADGAYRVAVSRTATPDQREVFLLQLREPLPVLPIPLRRAEPEIALELQPLIDLCCEHSGLRTQHYARPLHPPLAPADAEWAAERLRAAGAAS
jgi:hypothetical protein